MCPGVVHTDDETVRLVVWLKTLLETFFVVSVNTNRYAAFTLGHDGRHNLNNRDVGCPGVQLWACGILTQFKSCSDSLGRSKFSPVQLKLNRNEENMKYINLS